MKHETLILVPNPKGVNAPIATLKDNALIVRAKRGFVFNYAVSTGDGSVVQKGIFEGEVELELVLTDSASVFQLDIFNSDHHFFYNFIASGETLAKQ